MSYGVKGWWKSCGATVVAMLAAVEAVARIHSSDFVLGRHQMVYYPDGETQTISIQRVGFFLESRG
jgi:hypothetical protein